MNLFAYFCMCLVGVVDFSVRVLCVLVMRGFTSSIVFSPSIVFIRVFLQLAKKIDPDCRTLRYANQFTHLKVKAQSDESASFHGPSSLL